MKRKFSRDDFASLDVHSIDINVEDGLCPLADYINAVRQAAYKDGIADTKRAERRRAARIVRKPLSPLIGNAIANEILGRKSK